MEGDTVKRNALLEKLRQRWTVCVCEIEDREEKVPEQRRK